MSDENGTFLLKEKDFVEWVDAAGNELPAVPKHWGADQLPPGATKKGKAAKTSTSGSSSGSTPPPPVTPVDDFPSYTNKPRPEGWESFTGDQKRAYIYAGPDPKPDAAPQGEEPAGNASREAWAEYAVKVKGAKPEDLLDGDGKELGRDELRTKFGTSTGS